MFDHLPTTITHRFAESTLPGMAQQGPSPLGPNPSQPAGAWWEGARGRYGACLLLPPLFFSPYCGLSEGLFHLRAWLLNTIPRAWLDIITMTTAIYEHTHNRDEIDKRLACHEKYNKFLI